MVEPDFLGAILPLFEEGVVDCVEWSVDLGWSTRGIPEWLRDLLATYEARDALYAHGVHFSPFSAEWQPEKDAWLSHLAQETRTRRYQTLSEHLGFSTVPGIRVGAPFPFPFCAAALDVGRARLERLHAVSGLPVGLENLPLAFCEADAWAQGPFLRELLGSVSSGAGAFLHLDVHNLHCQVENFGCDPLTLLETYPLERVRTMHVSGGSWADTADARLPRIRQDTHDHEVPEGAFELLRLALERAPDVEAVFLERLGGTIRDEAAAAQFRADYTRMTKITRATAKATPTATTTATTTTTTTATADLAVYQRRLIDALLRGEEAAEAFRTSAPAPWREITRSYEPRMLRLAARIANSYTLRGT